MNMRVAVVIPAYGPLGGAERFSYELTQRIADRSEFEVDLLANRCQQVTDSVTFQKIPYVPFPRFLRPIFFALFVGRRVRKNKYAIVHAHERIFESDVLTLHGIPHKTWAKEVRGKSLSLFDRATAWVEKRGISGPNAPMLLPVSELVKEEHLKIYSVPEDRIRTIYPGVSPELIAGVNRERFRKEVRKRYEITPQDIVILFVGMNFEVKRLDLVLKGFSQIGKREHGPPVKLLVVGRGDIDKYRAMSSELGIGRSVIFVGVAPRVDMYYYASDIFVMPSRFDTFGIVVLEAMAAGLPVIITSKVGARDLVRDGFNGFVLPDAAFPAHLTEKIDRVLDQESRMKMGKNARQVAAQYTWDRTTKEVLELYRELACAKKKGSEGFWG